MNVIDIGSLVSDIWLCNMAQLITGP